jgi:plastocyanin
MRLIRRRSWLLIPTAVAGIAAIAVAVPAFAGTDEQKRGSSKPKMVQVRDYFYSPELVRIPKGGRVKWDWGEAPTDAHDVALYKGPRSVKKGKFRSPVGSAPFTWAKTFRRAGTYKFWCTLHATEMRMQVRVRR